MMSLIPVQQHENTQSAVGHYFLHFTFDYYYFSSDELLLFLLCSSTVSGLGAGGLLAYTQLEI